MAPRTRFAAITTLAVVVVAALAPSPAVRAAQAVPAVPQASAASPDSAGAGEQCEAEAPGVVAVRVVVDYGDLAEAPAEPGVVCVSVPEGADGSEVLAARAEQLGTPAPRYEASGLLCAIDGVPETGCGEPTDTGYRYWSYWLGTAEGWEYASVGPAFRSAEAAVSEGWRFVDGAGGPDDPPPGSSPDPATGAPSGSSGSSGSPGSSSEGDSGPAGSGDGTARAGDGAAGAGDGGGTLAGTLAGTAAGVLAVGVLAAAAVVVSRRRST